MRVALISAILAVSCTAASAEFYVVQNLQTRQCSIESEYPVSTSAQILVKNKFMLREDAEAEMKKLAVCN